MKRMTQWVMTAALTFCGAIMMLTSCTDAIGTADNPVNPEPPYDPAGELAKETFIHESYMDRTVKPGDSFWHFALGSYLKQPDDLGTMMEAGFYQQAILMTVNEMKAYNSPNHAMQLLLEEKSSADDEKAVLDGVLARMKPGNDISNSGFRCESVNRKVGGVSNSQHLFGQAADIRPKDPDQFQQLVDFFKSCEYTDQLLTGHGWLHISWNPFAPPRHFVRINYYYIR